MIAKKYRIDRNLIEYILEKGELFTSKLFIIRYIKNDKEFCRFRTIVSRKMDPKATKRNTIKRQIYEAVRKETKRAASERSLLKKDHFDIVLIPKKRTINAKFTEIQEDIEKTIPKLHE